MRLYLVIACLILSSCSTKPPVTKGIDDWTGFTHVMTAEYEILRNNTAIMTARGIMITRDGQRGFAVLTSLRRLVPNGPIIRHMYSGDTQLDYHRHDRPLTHCVDRCRRTELGAIHMTEAAFRIASQTGMPLRVQGRRGRYEATVPPSLFAAVLGSAE
ncbi:hypothetical protein QTO30_06790 [Yoonia sp. GPGPB17]|uniref:hypothetical protein n=1 Tax=Yoonia sp. GPGPB17 TaxID=3026147 RepID=UPI0030C39965